MEKNETTNSNFSNRGCLIGLVVWGIIIFIAFKMLTGWWDSLGNSSSRSGSGKKPDEIELMSYAQTVLKDNLNNPKYSSYKGDYTFINTGLRYKIEGNVTVNGNKDEFYMIIQFTNDTYKEYDLISLQVGNKKVY